MKKQNTIWATVATLCTIIAAVFASSASCLFLYQPKAPKCLNK